MAQTTELQTHAGGAVARVGEIALLDVRFPFVGPVPGNEVYPVGADAALRGAIVNSGGQTDRLLQIVSPIAGSAVLTGPVEVPPGSTLLMGWAGPPSPPGFPPDSRSYVGLAELTTPLRSGQSYPVEFRFERAGPVLVHVPIATRIDPGTDRGRRSGARQVRGGSCAVPRSSCGRRRSPVRPAAEPDRQLTFRPISGRRCGMPRESGTPGTATGIPSVVPALPRS